MYTRNTNVLNINAGNLHHAYCIEGEREDIVPELLSFLEKKCAFPTRGNPDFWYEECETFGVDDSRRLKKFQSQTGASGRKIFVVATYALTREAQNALLKVFEEPTAGTHFFLVVPSVSILLPTLRSRVEFIFTRQRRDAEALEKAREYLRVSFQKRVALVKGIIDDKDKHSAIVFLNNLETVLHASLSEDRELASSLEDIEESRSYLEGRSPSVKIILEQLALTVPEKIVSGAE